MQRSEVQRLVRQIGLRPQRAAGQHFLTDESVSRRMLALAEVRPGSRVLEIGPGLGILTRALLKAGAQVMAVELDRRLFEYLQRSLGAPERFQLIHADIFKVNFHKLVEDRRYRVVANLPYSATSLVFRNFLEHRPRPDRMTVMVQKEVAERVVAPPGRMNLLGLSVQYYSEPKLEFTVAKTSFWPAPAVTSAVINCQLRPDRDPKEARRLFRLARAAFAGKRKQLHNSLASGLHLTAQETSQRLADLGIDGHLRPQELDLETWQILANSIF